MTPYQASTTPMEPASKTTSATLPQGIGEKDLFREAEADEGDATRELGDGVGPLGELVRNLRESDDGPRHELRKHRDIAREVDEVSERSSMTTVDVDGVAHRLEGVEADSQRQHHSNHPLDLELRQAQPARDRVEVVGGKIEVLEESQQ